MVTQINDVVYRIRRNPTSRMMVVHQYRLKPNQGAAQDEQLSGGSSGSGWRIVTARGVAEPQDVMSRRKTVFYAVCTKQQ
jgi:hypothetical protein